VFGVLSIVAEFERELLRERVRSGLAQARRAGKRVGRPPLRVFTPKDVAALRKERKLAKKSYRTLAAEYKTSVWQVHRLLEGIKVSKHSTRDWNPNFKEKKGSGTPRNEPWKSTGSQCR
jgi:DNA invertase Pin-like site-specific DNA recombinase